MITGKRHDFRIDYDVGFDERGRILGLDVMLASAAATAPITPAR
jgi:xanthine dehydrogenase large subunit